MARLLAPSMKVGLSLTKTVLKSLAINVLLSIGVTVATSATDAAIQKKIYGFFMTTLIISNEEIDEIMKIVKLLEECGLLINVVRKSIKNETKEQKYGFLRMFLDMLASSLLGNLSKSQRVKSKYLDEA